MPEAEQPIRLVVDGEVFDVRADPDQPGRYHYDWVSGRHAYGFGSHRSDRGEATTAEHEAAIRSFLAQINPATGYID